MPSAPFDGIIVDESHHFRNRATRRYELLARLAARAPVVLLSATPLQNRIDDLASQLALFLGERAFALDFASLSRAVVRGDDSVHAFLPGVAPPEWIDVQVDDSRTLRAVLDLPPPPRPLDGGDAGALRVIALVRAWASSRAALVSTLATRQRRSAAIEQGLAEGRVPTKREMQAWQGSEQDVQLGFASLLMQGSLEERALDALSEALEGDRQAMHALRTVIASTPDPDPARVAALRQLRARHPHERILAFSEYASTIVAFFRSMRCDVGIGAMTSHQARIASGVISRGEMLDRFAPLARHARASPSHEQVTLLLATDLLSEGVNLQDASIVVHLDLPWNPARLAQRVGRVRRPGGATTIRSYLIAPPARAAELLDADGRMRRKLAAASQIIGPGFSVLPPLAPRTSDAARNNEGASANAADEGALATRLAKWSGAGRYSEGCRPGAAVANVRGWIAALDDGRLVCNVNGRVTDDVASLNIAASAAEGPERSMTSDDADAALGQLAVWLDMDSLSALYGTGSAGLQILADVDKWLASALLSLPRHQRAIGAPLAAAIRESLQQPLPIHAERELRAYVARSKLDATNRLHYMQGALDIVRGAQHFVTDRAGARGETPDAACSRACPRGAQGTKGSGHQNIRGLVLFGPG